MSCIPSAAYRIILARCTTRNGIVTMLARRSSSARSSPESSITYWLTRGTTHHFAAPRSIPPDSPQDLRTRLLALLSGPVQMSENGISIELSKAQVNRVIREAVEDDRLLGLVEQTEKLGFRASPEQLEDRGLSTSLLRGLMVLACFPADGAGRSMTDVALELEMGVSTVHRYVSTLVEVGLLERDPVSRKYRLAVRG